MGTIRTKIFLTFLLLAIGTAADQVNYSLKEDKDTGSFVLQFNDKTKAKSTKKAKHARKLSRAAQTRIRKMALAELQPRKAFSLGGGLLAGGAGAAAGAMAMKNSQNNEFVQNMRNLKSEHRLLEMKNDVEKDNMHMLFSAKVAMAKVYSKVRSIDQDFQFMFQKKKDLLQEILPEISV